MYEYKWKEGLRKTAKYHKGMGRIHPTYQWTTSNLKPMIPNWEYNMYGAIKHLDSFAYYSPRKLDQVPVNGYLLPVHLFDEKEV